MNFYLNLILINVKNVYINVTYCRYLYFHCITYNIQIMYTLCSYNIKMQLVLGVSDHNGPVSGVYDVH